MMKKFMMATAAVAMSASMASAVTISIEEVWAGVNSGQNKATSLAQGIADRDAFTGGASSHHVVASSITGDRNFDALIPCTVLGQTECDFGTTTTVLQTSVGDFRPTPNSDTFSNTAGSGSSVTGPASGNTSQAVVITTEGDRDGGRHSVDGDNWLDSNDWRSFDWIISGFAGVAFQRLAFFLTDVNDSGNRNFQIFSNGTLLDTISSDRNRRDGVTDLVLIDFRRLVGADEEIVLRFFNTGTSMDGTGISGAQFSTIPLPAPILLLLSGMGIFGGVAAAKRRREQAAA